MHKLPPSSPKCQTSRRSTLFVMFVFNWRRAMSPENIFVTNSFMHLLVEEGGSSCIVWTRKNSDVFTSLPSTWKTLKINQSRILSKKERRWRKREKARAGIEPTAAAPSQPDCPGVSRSDHSAGSKESASWRALGLRSDWHGQLGLGGGRKKGKKQAEEAARTNHTWAVGLARRCRRRFDPYSRSFSLSSTSKKKEKEKEKKQWEW